MHRLFIILLSIFIGTFAIAQNNDSLPKKVPADFNGAYVKSYWYDARDIAIAPFQPTKERLISYGIAASAIGIAFTQDKNIQTFAQENRTEKSDWYSEHVFEPIGAGKYSMALMGVFYITGATTHKNRLKKTALLGVKAYLISGAYVQVLKNSFRRERPNVGEGDPWQWNSSFGHRSFISGHTTSAFSVATIIAKEYKSTVWVPILAYSVATVSGISRIHDNKHWASDVIGGACFGYGVATLIHNKNNWGVEVIPIIKSDGGGMSMVIPIN